MLTPFSKKTSPLSMKVFPKEDGYIIDNCLSTSPVLPKYCQYLSIQKIDEVGLWRWEERAGDGLSLKN